MNYTLTYMYNDPWEEEYMTLMVCFVDTTGTTETCKRKVTPANWVQPDEYMLMSPMEWELGRW